MTFGIPHKDTPTQYHYVVVYDTVTGEFDLDYETQGTVFVNGPVFHEDTNEWRRLHADEWEEDKTDYNIAGDALHRVLHNDLNKRLP
jgi:hypothetical protein